MAQRVVRLSVPMLALIVAAGVALPARAPQPQPPSVFAAQCAACHGDEGRGTAQGPALAMNPRVAEQTDEQLAEYLQRGNVAAGMPSFADLSPDDRASIVRYVKRLNVETIPKPVVAAPRRQLSDTPQPGDWRTYNGSESGNRFSPLEQITTANVATLRIKWVFPVQHF